MSTHKKHFNGLLAGMFLVALAGSAAAEMVMKTEHWANNVQGFDLCTRRIQAGYSRNLLARQGVKAIQSGGLDPESLRVLTDGSAGKQAAEGRSIIDGHPTILVYYLGSPKVITEAGVYSFNGDSRANQDFEVRFANNEKAPGQAPAFSEAPQVSTGYKILGKNGGGFHTSFLDRTGGPLVPFKADWVEFRIWRTYGVNAGEPAKTT